MITLMALDETMCLQRTHWRQSAWMSTLFVMLLVCAHASGVSLFPLWISLSHWTIGKHSEEKSRSDKNSTEIVPVNRTSKQWCGLIKRTMRSAFAFHSTILLFFIAYLLLPIHWLHLISGYRAFHTKRTRSRVNRPNRFIVITTGHIFYSCYLWLWHNFRSAIY